MLRGRRDLRKGAELEAELVSAIYAAMLGESDWQVFLDRLNGISDDAFSTFFHHDVHAGTGATTLVTEGFDEANRDYALHYGEPNPWMKKVAMTPIGEGVVGEQVVPRDEFRRTEYYNDFITRMGFETGIGLTLARDRGRYSLLSTLTRKHHADSNAERAATLTRLAPHLMRVFRYYRENRLDGFAVNLGDAVADGAGVGLVLLDDHRKVAHASAAGAQLLAEGTLLTISPAGLVRFRDQEMQGALEALIASPSSGSRMETFTHGRVEVRLVRIRLSDAVEFFTGPRVAIVVSDRHRLQPAVRMVAIASRYGLTPAEREVMERIAEGERVDTIAGERGVTEVTVRGQLKSIFAKTQTRSQVELVRMCLDG